jgi:hypothetical protein
LQWVRLRRGGWRIGFFEFGGLGGFVWQIFAKGFDALEILDGAAVHALGLRLIAEDQIEHVGIAGLEVEAFGEGESAVLGVGNFDVADEGIVQPSDLESFAVDAGLIHA